MSTEGTPQPEPSLLAGPLGLLTRLVLKFPVQTVAIGVTVALIALVLSGTRLGFRTSRLALINSECPYNRLWIDYIEEFGEEDDVVIVVEGAGRDQVVPVVERISEELIQRPGLFHAVLHEIDVSKIRPKGLYYLEPSDLKQIDTFLGSVDPIIQGQWGRLNLGYMLDSMASRLDNGSFQSITQRKAAEEEFQRLSESLLINMTAEGGQQRSPWPEMPSLIAANNGRNSGYMLTNDGRFGFVLLRLVNGDKDSFTQGSEGIDTLRELTARIKADPRHEGVEVGLTGLPVLENDEMRASQKSMLEASFLSLVGVACLFVAGFGGLRHPLITVASLLMALAWSLGYITLAIGHLNILSVSFGVILIGLGIDFGVHYVARYLQLHGEIRSSSESLVRTARGVGPGILTGAITTAIAFCTAGLTDFTGVAELGIIAGGGILLCCLAAMTVLPAMIYLADARRHHEILPAPLDIHGWMGPLFRHPKTLLVVTFTGTALVGLGLSQLWYDHNLLNLQPQDLESVKLERKLLKQSDQSVWYALSISENVDDLLARKKEFERLPSVQRVASITDIIPTDHAQKRPTIERIHARLNDLPLLPPTIPVGRLDDLVRILDPSNGPSGGSTTMVQARWNLEQVGRALRQMDKSQRGRRVQEYQQFMAGNLLNRLRTLRGMANPEPPQLADLPASYVSRFVSRGGRGGRYLLKIYAKGDIWDMEAMGQFVADVRGVDPRATGNPLQTYEASWQMKHSYEQAAWYALAAILFVLYLDFHSLRHILLAMLPLGLGMLQLFGILGWLGIPLNPANMIVLPLILGIGIDDGVHVVHDFRRQKGRYRMSPSTASAVLITSLTTMVGFGSLMIASHRGLQSLGRVLTIGVSCCLFTSLVMLPALLVLISRFRADSQQDESDEEEPNQQIVPRKKYRLDPPHHPGTSTHAVPRGITPRRESVEKQV